MTAPLRVGLAGLGTVGAGVVALLEANAGLIERRADRAIVVTAVSARDRGRDRGVDLSRAAWVDDATQLSARDDVDVVVEMIGGSDGPALVLARATLERGKAFVTANKAMLAHHGLDLAALAEAKGVALKYEAAVAGGIPVIKALRDGAAANRILRVYGILNGTCNYILTRMEAEDLSFTAVLARVKFCALMTTVRFPKIIRLQKLPKQIPQSGVMDIATFKVYLPIAYPSRYGRPNTVQKEATS